MATAKSSSFPQDARHRSRKLYPHYAWVIVSIIAIMQMVGASIRMAFGVFIDPLAQTFDWSQGTITLAYGVSSITTALASPLAGWFGDRYGARTAMVVGSVLFIIGMFMAGLIEQPWHLYLSFGVLMGTAQAIFLVPLVPAAMTWFRRHLGLGMGLLMASWGVGPALTAPIMGLLVEEAGWEGTMWLTAAGASVVMAVLVALFRNRPSDRGVLPYGALPSDPVERGRRPDPVRARLFAGYMRRTAAYWNMSGIHFLGCVGHAVVLVYIVPLAVQRGVPIVAAAGLLTTMSGVSVLSRLITPILADNFGARAVMAVFYFLQGVTVLLLFWAQDVWAFYLFAVAFGIGYGGESGGFPILNRKYFGHAPMGSPYGMQMLWAGMGMALGGWIGGVIFDITSSYDLALIVSIAASLAGAVCILLLEPTDRLLIPDWEKEGPEAARAEAPAHPVLAD